MAKAIEMAGKTVQEAVALALKELNASEDDVEIEVIDEGGKGIFGLLGNKMARVRVALKEHGADIAEGFLRDVFDKMKVNAQIDVKNEENSIVIKISGEDSRIIIGRRGETLDALQYLTSLVVNKGKDTYTRVTIDIENYRSKREETLVKLANKLAGKVIKRKRNITLEPMNPYERRIIHSSLQNNKYVETYSIGEEPNRKVVITMKKTAKSK